MASRYWKLRWNEAQVKLLNTNITYLEAKTKRHYLETANYIIDKLDALYTKITAVGVNNVTRNTVYQFEGYYETLRQCYEELDKMGVKISNKFNKSLTTTYKAASKLTADSINAKKVSYNTSFSNLDTRAVEAASEVWATDKKNWSDRLWTDTARLKMILEEDIFKSIAAGQGSKELIDTLRKDFSVSYSSAKRLAVTELTHIYNQASIDRMKAAGIKKYQILIASDARTCEECKDQNGKIYPVTDQDHLPPIHPNCRCTTLAVFDFSN